MSKQKYLFTIMVCSWGGAFALKNTPFGVVLGVVFIASLVYLIGIQVKEL